MRSAIVVLATVAIKQSIHLPGEQLDACAVDGAYALVGHYNRESGGQALFARNPSGPAMSEKIAHDLCELVYHQDR